MTARHPVATSEASAKVLAHASKTLMPADQFDELLDALDVPDEARALARLNLRAKRYRWA
jgi:uncharacterized protein (DUF1778 family)